MSQSLETSKATSEAQHVAVKASSLRKEFNVAGGVEIAVDDIDLEVGESEFVSLVGPSGCGKTTTLRCIAGLQMPTSGKISFHGHDVTDVPANKRNIAMMFQNIALYPHMKIRDNIAYPLKVSGVPKKERYEEAQKAAEIMQISDMLDKYPGELSGGQRQRGALARTVVQDPEMFLMDEPLSDLDAKLKVEIRKEIQRVQKEMKKPTLYVTHDQEEAMTMSDRIAVMNDGKIEQIGTPDELYNMPTNTFVAQFIGNPSINFLTAEVIQFDDDCIIISIDGTEFEFTVKGSGRRPTSSTVKVGFRPESVEISRDDGDISVDILLVERIGDRVLATLDGPEGEIRATVPATNDIKEGETVYITIDRENVHIFDEESGESVASTAAN